MARRASHENGTTTTYHHHLGTPRRITDQGDQTVGVHDYYAFGSEAAGGTAERSLTLLKYTGHERDVWSSESFDTLDYMHARYYSPSLGRFLSVDLHLGRREYPQTWNRYIYAGGTAEKSLTLLKYTGHERDVWSSESFDMLDYMHARYYSPSLGRSLSADPVLDVALALGSPQRWNRYAYVLNDPLSYVDPNGAEVDLSTVPSAELNSLLRDLNSFVGNEYGVDSSLKLNVITKFPTASPTATTFLDSVINSATVYKVMPRNGSNVIFAEADSRTIIISFDFKDFSDINYHGIDPRAFGPGAVLIHELAHLHPQPNGHALDDGPVALRATQVGPTENFVNSIRAERGLPPRGPAYEGQRGGWSARRVLVNFQVGNRTVYVSAREYH